MTRWLLCIAIIFNVSSIGAQKWQKVDQGDYGMKYELPVTWEIDGFGWSNDWETVGSAVCDCSGTINIGNRWSDEEIYMVVYPTRFKDSLNVRKRQMVWDMTFQPAGSQDILTAEYCRFTRKIGKWSEEGNRNYIGDEVWQLKTSKFGQYYVIYFWSRPELMKKYENTIAKIIASFRPVRAK